MKGIALNKKEADKLNEAITNELKKHNKFNSKLWCSPIELNNGLFLVLKPGNELLKGVELKIDWVDFNNSDIKINLD